MTGFFALDRSRVDLDELRPKGFKILLEILVRRRRTVAEVPFTFGPRHGGTPRPRCGRGCGSSGSWSTCASAACPGSPSSGRWGGGQRAARVRDGGVGTPFLVAAVVAAEVTMVANFLLQEKFVFADMLDGAESVRRRFLRSFAFNNVESAVRISLAWWLVSHGVLHSAIATAVTLAIAFVAASCSTPWWSTSPRRLRVQVAVALLVLAGVPAGGPPSGSSASARAATPSA